VSFAPITFSDVTVPTIIAVECDARSCMVEYVCVCQISFRLSVQLHGRINHPSVVVPKVVVLVLVRVIEIGGGNEIEVVSEGVEVLVLVPPAVLPDR